MELEINKEQLATVETDIMELRAEGEKRGVYQLEGRVQHGLDPAAMMVLRDTRPLTEKIAQDLGTEYDKLWPLIDELHKQGPWKIAKRLATATEPEIKAYFVLAAACHEKPMKDVYTPPEYLADRTRVMKELDSFTPDQFAVRRQSIVDRIQHRENVHVESNGKEITVPIAEGDPALAFAIEGFKGCVTRGGENYFAQTAEIRDEVLQAAGLLPGFGEIRDSTGNFQRVLVADAPANARIVWVRHEDAKKNLVEMAPAAKRISPGYVLTYTNKDLAVDLVARAVS